VFNTLLQVLEDGRLTDSQGRTVDFKNTVIIMTTNLGTRDIAKGLNLGFAAGDHDANNYERMKQKVNEELKQHFRPEFLNRVDDTIVFHQLREEDIVEIVDLMITRVDVQMKNRDMAIELTADAKRLLATKGYDPVLGARPLRRTIQREIEDILSEKILYGELTAGQIVVVDTETVEEDERFTFRGEIKPVAPDAPPVEEAAAAPGAAAGSTGTAAAAAPEAPAAEA
jgi:ATP-dependent Clp protease ATP-binding subunit ClpC